MRSHISPHATSLKRWRTIPQWDYSDAISHSFGGVLDVDHTDPGLWTAFLCVISVCPMTY